MGRCFVYTLPGASPAVRIMFPSEVYIGHMVEHGWDEALILQLILEKDIPKGAQNITELDTSELPPSGTYDRAWFQDATGKISTDMPAARLLKMVEIRRERNAKLDLLDKEFMKALSTKQDTKAITDKMQALRDIPQTIDLSGILTPEELEAFQPEWPK